MENYNRMNVLTLKNLARERGLRGYSTLRKVELIEQLISPPPPKYTRAQLIQLARERGLRGYSTLRKAELLQRLGGVSRGQILDQDIDTRMANVPFLTPTPYTRPQATPASTPSLNAVEDLINYLDDNVRKIPKSVSPRVEKLQKEIKSIYEMKSFEVIKSESALSNFVKVYIIDGKSGYDAQSFLDGTRENITRILRDNRGTKVKLIFKCYMERPSNLVEMVIKPVDFHSEIVVNLDGADEQELYDMMVDRIIEKISTFQNEGSQWRFYKVIRLELHTVSYNPSRGGTWIPLPK